MASSARTRSRCVGLHTQGCRCCIPRGVRPAVAGWTLQLETQPARLAQLHSSALSNTHLCCTSSAAHPQPTQVIRPGQFMPGPIRESGLKWPLLIKGDR